MSNIHKDCEHYSQKKDYCLKLFTDKVTEKYEHCQEYTDFETTTNGVIKMTYTSCRDIEIIDLQGNEYLINKIQIEGNDVIRLIIKKPDEPYQELVNE